MEVAPGRIFFPHRKRREATSSFDGMQREER